MRIIRTLATVTAIAVGFVALHCGGSTSTGTGTGDGGTTLGEPPIHRPTATACSTTRPPGYNSDAGLIDGGVPMACTRDADCTTGNNGRCQPSRVGYQCNYDTCVADTDCGANGVCYCGVASPSLGRAPNACVKSVCRVDADCGAGNYCSPTYDASCGAYSGVVGYYCHTATDECRGDADCKTGEGGLAGGFCAWQPTTSKWQCSFSACAG